MDVQHLDIQPAVLQLDVQRSTQGDVGHPCDGGPSRPWAPHDRKATLQRFLGPLTGDFAHQGLGLVAGLFQLLVGAHFQLTQGAVEDLEQIVCLFRLKPSRRRWQCTVKI